MVVWYPSIQAYTLTGNSYTETGTDADPVDYVSRYLELGPFDGPMDVMEGLRGWLNDDFPFPGVLPPVLPGS